MRIVTLLTAVILSFFSTAVMSYIAMATGIGPWIETTLVLAGMLLFYGLHRWYSADERSKAIGLVAATGGIGGIVATACGFTFPTLYFLDPEGFASLLRAPWQFAGILSLVVLAAGSFGLLVAQYFEYSLIEQQQLPFPIGELVYKMITAADSFRKAVMLAIGFIGTQAFLLARAFISFLCYPLVLLRGYTIGIITLPKIALPTDLLPMFWAIGFVTGHVIALPLLVGMLSKIFVIEPLYQLYPQIYGMVSVPQELSKMDFTIAFASGLVFYGALKGFLGLPKVLKSAYAKLFDKNEKPAASGPAFPWYLGLGTLCINILALSYFQFSFLAQIYLIIFTFVCTYQLMVIAGKFGIAPLGRFATFVMVPYMLIFGYSPLQTTLVALYVEVAGGVACDALFGRKMARLASIEKRSIAGYQWLGLFLSALAIGVVFWLFINHFGLGNQVGALAVTRAASRALLISVKSFDVGALVLGLIFAYFISYLRISSALLLGGILMPVSYTIMLVLGGYSTYLVEDKEDYYPFWSGVFAANSLWMLLQAFI